MRIHQEQRNRNSSDMICRYLGFEGAFATVSGGQYDASSIDADAEAAAVICPPNTTSITDCWHNETMETVNEENIAVVCCPGLMCNPLGDPLGLERGTIPDSAITSSGCHDSESICTQYARLNGPSAWVPSQANPKWLDVQFESSYVVTGIATQGRPGFEHWTRSYTISFSTSSGDRYNYFNVYSREIQVFGGNSEQYKTSTHVFVVPMLARSVRIHPHSYSYIALRLELYGYGPLNEFIASMNRGVQLGCTPPVLGEGLGVEDGRIPDSSLTSSSVYQSQNPDAMAAYRGRLNAIGTDGETTGWTAALDDQDKWIKVDLGKESVVTGVITQGGENYIRWYTSLQISYSVDNQEWTYALEKECGSRRTYPGNLDGITPSTKLFPKPVVARYIRLHPFSGYYFGGMRFEILGVVNFG
ncbi:lactadherin-like [Strongylocentrotus purpuratus]|uniref:F5/8 type C domain-containing protein n=1 Tax=Strongylocentrotus purpuratus TaxID=7668 RepID=A0A7M7HLV1_STRPU|nr:lactadherin-like [Strongylocentrotus purpuratus]|eukprot:XP_011669610.1 PREDICTED: lactadherin-like [Strongylocentrotus purpuratus]